MPRAFPDAYPAASVINSQIRLLYYSCGKNDKTADFAAFQRSEAMLTDTGFRHETTITTQDHTWENFRRELANFLPKLR